MIVPTPVISSALSLVDSELSMLWSGINDRVSMYARGSAVRLETHNPLDIDIVLFVNKDHEESSVKCKKFSFAMSSKYDSIPTFDFSVFNYDQLSGETAFGRLLVSDSALLIFGEDIRISLSELRKQKTDISLHVLDRCCSRLLNFLNCHDPKEIKLRTPHLAKSILRLGGILSFYDGNYFTRDSYKSSSVLLAQFPSLKKDIDTLLSSFTIHISKDLTSRASENIIKKVIIFLNE